MCQCHTAGAYSGPCTNPHPCPACLARMKGEEAAESEGNGGKGKSSALWLPCFFCALWLPCREDSTGDAEDYGICPRRQWPHNRTQGIEGCLDGVMSDE